MKEDRVYNLRSFLEEEAANHEDYQDFEYVISKDGYQSVILKNNHSVKVFEPHLAFFLTLHEPIAIKKENSQEQNFLLGTDYLNTYVEAFGKGEAYFADNYQISSSQLYSEYGETYVNDIKYKFFDQAVEGYGNGWQFVKKTWPFLISHKVISDFGYYSGIVARLREFVCGHIKFFEGFDGVFRLGNNSIKEVSEKKKSYPQYCQVGALFTQDYIKLKEGKYCYKDNCFSTAKGLERFLQAEVLGCKISIRQYLAPTLHDNNDPKNLFRDVKRMSLILEYCQENKITVSGSVMDKYRQLKDRY